MVLYGTVSVTGQASFECGYNVYEVGQEVTVGDENFYVLEASDANTSTVTLLAKYLLCGQFCESQNFGQLAYGYSTEVMCEFYEAEANALSYATALGGTNGRLLTLTEVQTLSVDYGTMIWGTREEGVYDEYRILR